MRLGAIIPLQVENSYTGRGTSASGGSLLTLAVYPDESGPTSFRYRQDSRSPWVTFSSHVSNQRLTLSAEPALPGGTRALPRRALGRTAGVGRGDRLDAHREPGAAWSMEHADTENTANGTDESSWFSGCLDAAPDRQGRALARPPPSNSGPHLIFRVLSIRVPSPARVLRWLADGTLSPIPTRPRAVGSAALAVLVGLARPALACSRDTGSCPMLTQSQDSVRTRGSFGVDVAFRTMSHDRYVGRSGATSALVDFENGRVIGGHHRDASMSHELLQLDVSYGLSQKLTLFSSLPILNRRAPGTTSSTARSKAGRSSTSTGRSRRGTRAVRPGDRAPQERARRRAARRDLAVLWSASTSSRAPPSSCRRASTAARTSGATSTAPTCSRAAWDAMGALHCQRGARPLRPRADGHQGCTG